MYEETTCELIMVITVGVSKKTQRTVKVLKDNYKWSDKAVSETEQTIQLYHSCWTSPSI